MVSNRKLGASNFHAPTNMPTPLSIKHQHLLSIVSTKLKSSKVVSVLDVGCGREKMISFFDQAFTVLFPDSIVKIYSFDQAGHGALPWEDPAKKPSSTFSRAPGFCWTPNCDEMSQRSRGGVYEQRTAAQKDPPHGGRTPFGLAEVEAMSRAASPFAGRRYGVARVTCL